ncbi:MBL fold metallo-hydrolase [bacterium]|nr:MBL fold metallo-hydrolase [bacterium]
MIVKHYQTGPLEVNTYAIIDEKTKKAALIDVGGWIKNIVEDLKKDGVTVEFILNTHGHFDHILGEKEAQDLFNLPVYIHKNDIPLVERIDEQTLMWDMPVAEEPEITGTFEDGDEIELGDLKIKVLHVPGHTPGGVGFYCENTLFSGDSLFYHSIGRTDLPLGNHQDLIKSVKEKFLTLPDDTRVLPGHDRETTIGFEKENNEFFK